MTSFFKRKQLLPAIWKYRIMQLKIQKEHYGKLTLIGISLLVWLLITVLFKTYGYERTWELWKVPTEMPPFVDFRLISGSADSFLHGFEPTIKNPYDPRQRIFNYPTFWRLFFYVHMTEAEIILTAISMILLFFVGAFLFPHRISVPGAISMLGVLFSPAAMLLYERGNVDLVVFFVCVMIVIVAGFSANLAALLILFGAVIKMFPFFGISILLKEPKTKFWILFASSFVALLIYMVVTWRSIKASWDFTMRGDKFSYGTNVFFTRYGSQISTGLSRWLALPQVDLLFKYGPLAIGFLLLGVVAFFAVLNTDLLPVVSERNFAAFRMGASIYVGTFLLGNNWDYRLTFLVLVIPQLIEWLNSSYRMHRYWARTGMFFIFFSCWHLWITTVPLGTVFHFIADSQNFWFVVDEIVNWSLFLCLAYLLFASTPDWLKNPMRNLLPVRL